MVSRCEQTATAADKAAAKHSTVSVSAVGFNRRALASAKPAAPAAPAKPAENKDQPKPIVPSTVGPLDAKEWRSFTVSDIKKVNHNTREYIVKVDGLQELPVASFVMARAIIDGKEEARPYTPIEPKDANQMHLLIKTYEHGKFSRVIEQLKPGDKIDLKGPFIKFDYKPNWKKEIGMLAGGSGITPMLQLLRKIASNPEDKTKVSLVFFNVTEEDILLKDQLDALAAKNKNFKVTYSVDNPKTKDWKGEKGRVNEKLISKYMPKPGADSIVMVCGPNGFVQTLSGPKAKDYTQGDLTGMLKNLGYSSGNVFKC